MIPANPSRDLLLAPESYEDLITWERELRSHIAFANKLVAAGVLISVNARKH
jgi:hypothetical protein